MKDIAEEIAKYDPGNNRSQVKVTKKNTLICDSYNANPSSMRLAIESFLAIAAEKKMVILGDMLELGERGGEEHKKILKILEENKIKNVLLAGPIFNRVSAGTGYKSFPDVKKLSVYLAADPPKGFHILVKGSRGVVLDQLYDLL